MAETKMCTFCMHLLGKKNNSFISTFCQYSQEQCFLRMTIFEDRIGPLTERNFAVSLQGVPSLFPAFISQMAQGQILERRFSLF